MIDGHKWFSSGADGAAFAIVMAVTDPDAAPHARATQIVVPAETPGRRRSCVRSVVMGHAGKGWSTHCEVRYTSVRVPVANTLGAEGDGFRIAQKRLGPGRIHHVMRWLGQMQRAFELMCSYALARETSTGPLSDKQTVQNWIADSYAEIQACRLMTLDAAHKIDGGDEARVEVSAIKFFAAKVLEDVIDRAVQVHGARGLTDETPLAGMLMHARGGRIYDGPDEVHRQVVAKRILKAFAEGRGVAFRLMWTHSRASCSSRRPRCIDPNFRKTVVLIAHHDDDGAMGLVLSRPSDVAAAGRGAGARRATRLGRSRVRRRAGAARGVHGARRVRRRRTGGGADLRQRRLHARRSRARRAGDPRFRLFSGYAGWGAGQLEAELEEPSWIVVAAEPDDAFADDPDELWRTVLHRKGGPFELMVDMPFDPGLN